MFKSEEERNRAFNDLNESIRRFSNNYGVTVDITVFERANSKKSANEIYINTFKSLIRQIIQSGKTVKAASMRSAFERDVVGPFRAYSINNAKEDKVASIKSKLPDVYGGLKKDEWWRQHEKNLDSIYWEKIDNVVNNYKSRSLRIRDMVANTKRILAESGEISHDNVKKIASYAAALRRANKSRPAILNFFGFIRSNAEKREADSIEKMLNERLGDKSAYENAIKEITDPVGCIANLMAESKANRTLKIDFLASQEKAKPENPKVNKQPEKKVEKEQVIIEDDVEVLEYKEEIVPGNERLYSLISDKSFESNIKNEIWNTLKLKETLTFDKKTTDELLYKPLLRKAKSANEDYMNLASLGMTADEYADDLATTMFTEAFMNLESLNMEPKDRLVAAQKIADIMLNKLTVIGFEKERFGKYGDCYAVKNESTAEEMLNFKAPMSEEASDYIIAAANKELSTVERERVSFTRDSDRSVGVSVKHEERLKPSVPSKNK